MNKEENLSTRKVIDELYKNIEESNDAIELIREKCPHDESKIEKYMWKIGSIIDAEICVYCDKVLTSVEPEFDTRVTYSKN